MKTSVHGFSLLELVIVIGIIGILSAIGYYGFSEPVANGRARDQMKKLQGVLNDARNTARNERNCVDVSFGAGLLVTVETTDCSGNTLTTDVKAFPLLAVSAPPVNFNQLGELATPATVDIEVFRKGTTRKWDFKIRGMIGMTEIIQ